LSSRLLELKTGRARVLVKHTERIERELVKVFAAEFEEFFHIPLKSPNLA
jgi:tRNA A37 methylthiotransferase MiaB